MSRDLFFVLALCSLGGCFSSELDPSLSGVFACEADEDCPDGQSCLGSTCFSDDDIPTVEIVSPELGAPIPLPGGNMQVQIPITVRTNLDLVPQDADAMPGLEGYLRAELVGGGAPNVLAEEGTGEITLTLVLDPTDRPRPLKILVRAFTANGTEFPNEEAVDRTVFFLDDGMTPQVAITDPWPNAEFPPEAVSGFRVSVASINYTLRPPTGTEAVPGMGHVHILQRNPDAAGTFPVQCLVTRTNCDTESDFYTPINPAMPSMFFEAPITLNREGDGAGPNGIAAVLVTDIHTSITAFDPMFMEQRVVTDLVPLNRMPGN